MLVLCPAGESADSMRMPDGRRVSAFVPFGSAEFGGGDRFSKKFLTLSIRREFKLKNENGTGKTIDLVAGERLPRAAPGEEYTPMLPASAGSRRSDALFGRDGHRHGHRLFGCGGLSGAQNRTGVRGGDPDRHYRRGHGQRARQAQHAGPERHHPVDRRFVGRDRRRGDLHAAGALHPGAGRGVLPDLPFVVDSAVCWASCC